MSANFISEGISDNGPSRPDADITKKYRTAAPDLKRISNAPPALARISAQQFPNLHRASMQSKQNNLRQVSVGPRAPALGRTSVVRAEQELARRSASLSVAAVTLTLMMSESDSGRAVTYKGDGTRFTQSAYTLKLVEGKSYRISVALSPDTLTVQDSCVTLLHPKLSGGIVRDAIELESSGRALAGCWRCEAPVCDKGSRHAVELSAFVDGFGELVLPLSIKVYGAGKSRSAHSGLPLKSAIFDLKKTGEDATAVVQLKRQQWVAA